MLPQRQTALVAKQAAEVDILTGGRLRLGVGIGWNHVEFEGSDADFRNRGRRRGADRGAAPALGRARNIEFVKGELKARCDALVAALHEQIPEAEFVVPDGGYFLWLDLAEGTDTAALLAEAKGDGVSFVAGPDFMIDGGDKQPPPLLRPGPGRPRRRRRLAHRQRSRASPRWLTA